MVSIIIIVALACLALVGSVATICNSIDKATKAKVDMTSAIAGATAEITELVMNNVEFHYTMDSKKE